MPFAPTILAERAGDYLFNPKVLASPYMMLAMPTRAEARDLLTAAIHPHDGTARPQILERTWNPEYYAVIDEFERRTGIGAVLNTSFNLHGEPIVCSAADAVDTFERSGLPPPAPSPSPAATPSPAAAAAVFSSNALGCGTTVWPTATPTITRGIRS